MLHHNFCDNNRNRGPHGCSMQLFVVFTVVLKVSRCKAKVQSSVGYGSLAVDCCIAVSVQCNAN